MIPPKIKLTAHPAKRKYVVNTPGSHVQRQPRVYTSLVRAAARVLDIEEGRA